MKAEEQPRSQAALPAAPSPADDHPRQTLSLFDSTSIIVGTIVGAGVYETLSLVAQNVGSLTAVLAVWTGGAAIALVGALCYAELAGTFPLEGGDYVYLSKAFGRRVGFLFAWSELWIVRPGNTGAMAYIFARYANQLAPLPWTNHPLVVYATASIVVITLINILGVQSGKWAQNLLTSAKVLGLLAVFALALSGPGAANEATTAAASTAPNYALAMILVMFTYGGWSDVSYVAAEIRQPRVTILRAMLLGLAVVAGLYLLANVAFIRALGLAGFQQAAEGTTAAAEVARLQLGERGVKLVSALICITTLGAINAQVFTSARVYYALGRDHARLALLGRWNARLGSPIWALATQAAVTLPLVAMLGFQADAFNRFVVFTAPVFWCFFFLVGISLFYFRLRAPSLPRPFLTPGYPATPAIFCLASLGMLASSVQYAAAHWSVESYWVLGFALLGVVASRASQDRSASGPSR